MLAGNQVKINPSDPIAPKIPPNSYRDSRNIQFLICPPYSGQLFTLN